jgi:6-pyruvoyltetrahydropterin/6-carboxytetrahydropterin synthase
MIVVKDFAFEAAHRLPSHKGLCRYIHGHSYVVQVGIRDNMMAPRKANGMVLDFKDLKQQMEDIIGNWDHALILDKEDPMFPQAMELAGNGFATVIPFKGEPTAENMAEYIAGELTSRLKQSVDFVRVWETATAYAEWRAV